MKKNKWLNSKLLFTMTLFIVLFSFMTISTWAARKIDISSANAMSFIGKLNQNGAELISALGLDSDEGFQLLRQITDANGETHYRYQQTYKGFPVWGMQTIVSKGHGNIVLKLHGNFVQGSSGDVGGIPASLDPAGALRQMQELHRAKDTSASWHFSNEKYGTYVYFHKKSQKARLCYVVSFFADNEKGNPSQPIFFINVKNGKIIDTYDMLRYQGIGPGGNEKVGYYYYGTDYDPFCVTENGSTCTMECTDVRTVDLNHGTTGSTSYSYTCYENTHEAINGAYCPLNDAQYFGQVVFDTYMDWYGVPVLPFQLTLRCHYSTNYENAFWDGSTMTFGDGYTTFYPLVSLDVVGHEVSHGFTEYNSGLIYSSQSGGINEAFSDMAGEACEYYMRGTNDFMCGYDIYKAPGQALRYLYDPPLDGISIDNVDDYYEGMNVHYSSGIFNKAFYLIATSPGWDTHMAFDIFVRANQVYWVPSSTFVQGAEGVMDAAVDLGYNCQHVVDAFAQVGITLVCPGPPIADFTASLTTGGVPLTTHFTDLSQAASSWLWDFGDGIGTSTEKNPTYTYNTQGIFTVTLTATNQFGSDTEIKVDYITVTAPQPPIADFTADNTDINLNNVVHFTDLSLENPTSWSWTFEGGTPATSTEQNPAVTYTTVGTFDVTLVVSNAQGTDTMTKVDYISVSEKPYCASQGNTYSMEWIAGVQVGTMNNPSGAAGYTDFTNITCELTGGDTVNVVLTPGFSSYTYTEYWKIWIDYNDDHDFEDAGEEVFSGYGSSTVTGSFTVADVDIVSRMRVSMKYAGYPSPCESFTYGEVEDYTVDVTTGGCPVPAADFSADNTTITEGESVNFTDLSTNNPDTWDWTFAGGTPGSSTQQNPTVTYYTAGTYTVTLTATNACGSDTETKVGYITVEPPCQPTVADFSASATTIYEGDSVTFTDLSTNAPNAWDWTFAGGTPGTSTQQNPTVTYNTEGTYTVTLTATNACGSDTETKVDYITVLPIPITEMYVYDITQTIVQKGKNHESNAVVTIRDTTGAPVANATVFFTWSGVVNGSDSAVTGADGTASFKSSKTKTASGSFILTVDNVTHATLPYNSDLNNETTDTQPY